MRTNANFKEGGFEIQKQVIDKQDFQIFESLLNYGETFENKGNITISMIISFIFHII